MKDHLLAVSAVQDHQDELFLATQVVPSQSLRKSHVSSATAKQVIKHQESVATLMKQQMTRVLSDEVSDDAFYVADVGEVIRQHVQWTQSLPRVEPFYAVKCNPDPIVLQTMVRLGTGFDCASKAEIDAVLALGVDPNRIIYANPCKAASHIRHAAAVGVRMMTFDNADELHKIKKHHPNPLMVLRVLTDDSRSVCKFGVKFGAPPATTRMLLETAKALAIEVIGVSFHVGSGCFDAGAFHDAIVTARRVFDQGEELGFKFSMLDVGGGFPGSDCSHGISFRQIVDVLRPALDEHFPDTHIIAEPGRYFVSAAYTLAVNVHARRVVAAAPPTTDNTKQQQQQSYMYYINEGLYSSFNCIYFDHAAVAPRVLVKDGVYHFGQDALDAMSREEHFACSIWGPTCDSMDMITRDGSLPALDVGDWLYFDHMGAYTVAAASTFNGFKRCNVIWTNTEAQRCLV
ncbi:Ornithine decarboxylase [Sorochytrium milnesiophthora]